MKITKVKDELEKNIEREWLVTNGIGGYASSTILGINTRKYHGLLVAPLSAPSNRHVILSKVDESITFENETKYELYTNVCENYIGQGYKNQESFEKDVVPKFTYKIEGVSIEKTICMQYQKNTIVIKYKIKNKDKKAKLELAPIFNFRDFHSMNNSVKIDMEQSVNEKAIVEIELNKRDDVKIKMLVNDSKYTKFENNMFWNMFYLEEEKRGFYPIENHIVSGIYTVEIDANEQKEVSFICSIEDEDISKIDVNKIISNEKKRIKNLITNFEKDEELELDKNLIKDFIVSLDNFIIYRKESDLYSAIAGYHWFLDWGRDTLISFEGLVLVTKRFDIAKQILKMLVKDVKQGLVPNGYSEFDNKPLYNSVDSSLLLFEQVKKYIKYTNDYEFVKTELYKVLVDIIENYEKGIDLDNNNIYLDSDNLIVSGTKDTQNTWMDAKYDGIAVTPRNGKCVEINSLWYNANKIMCELAKEFEDKETLKKCKLLADKCKKTFEEKFYNKKRKCLYDVLRR